MEHIIKFLSSDSKLAWIVAISLLLLIFLIGSIIFHAYWTDRLISFWPLKLRPKDSERKPPGASQPVWNINSREVNESKHWTESSKLVVGVQYSPKFFKDYYTIVKERSLRGLSTVALVLDPEGTTTNLLKQNRPDEIDVRACVDEIIRLMKEADGGRGYVKIKQHNRIMRYSFILTEKCIWVKFFTNTADRTIVPAVKVDASHDLYKFFSKDAERLESISDE